MLLLRSASVPGTKEDGSGLIQRNTCSWSACKRKQTRGLIDVNTQSTNENLFFLKIGAWSEPTRTINHVDCNRNSRVMASSRIPSSCITGRFPERMPQVASTASRPLFLTQKGAVGTSWNASPPCLRSIHISSHSTCKSTARCRTQRS